MSWSSPRTFTAGEIITAAILNTHLRDQLRYLKGSDGIPTVESGLIIDATDGDEYIRLPALTTSETTSTLTIEANVAYDETLHKVKYYSSGSVEVVLARDDVDDVPVNSASTVPISSNWAYDFINTLTASGDIPYANGAGSWTRLAKGTAGQYLVMNNTASGPGWTTAVPPTKIVKTANETVSNSVTFQNDDELKLALGPNTTWEFSCIILANSNSSADIKFQWTTPSSAAVYVIYNGYDSAGNQTQQAINTGAAIVGGGVAANALTMAIRGVAVCASVSGDLQLQWAQNSADVNPTTVLAGSHIIGHQLV